ncbi:hypothetical protein F7984_01460 [Pradoshia sp. D12]|uniref:TasA family protein n=1 Tax=Bacillaceae TaxID=186817 RepID=UPI00112876AA|nr:MULTISPECIES: TasA family protein [Bacillaceae]QFK70024.1 hypothetical protein F7984_01460 [Pradoshia sp. D12]TPF70584.1 hypothetical protein FHY44_16595 [Bacillus sp. D12]
MKKGSTKRALVTSIVSTCASVTMLAGATFAWFTDTASTGVNEIKAGTLDIALLDAEGKKSVEGDILNWKTADGREQDKILWEPGATYDLETVTVKNNGNLAAKYKVLITGINGDEELNEAIDWKIDGADIDKEYKLATGASEEITISGTMKRTAGNEYQGKSIEGIGITVVATQDTVEKDSKDNQYDKDAAYTYQVVTNTKDTQAAVKAGKDVIFDSDIAVKKEELGSSGYGATGIAQHNGGVIDGNGKTLSIEGANGTWDSAISTKGGTIKNLTIDSGFRGIFIGGAKSDVIVDNVIIDGTVYTISCDDGGGKKLIVTNSTLNGWTSYAGTLSEASFTNCNFGEGSGYAFMRPYAKTILTDCEFSAGFELDSRQAAITLKNCKVNGELVTADNVTDLLGEDAQYVTIKNS